MESRFRLSGLAPNEAQSPKHSQGFGRCVHSTRYTDQLPPANLLHDFQAISTLALLRLAVLLLRSSNLKQPPAALFSVNDKTRIPAPPPHLPEARPAEAQAPPADGGVCLHLVMAGRHRYLLLPEGGPDVPAVVVAGEEAAVSVSSISSSSRASMYPHTYCG